MLGSPPSPDGAGVAFVHKKIGSKNNYVTNIWMMDTDRETPVQFTNGSRDGALAWSRTAVDHLRLLKGTAEPSGLRDTEPWR